MAKLARLLFLRTVTMIYSQNNIHVPGTVFIGLTQATQATHLHTSSPSTITPFAMISRQILPCMLLLPLTVVAKVVFDPRPRSRGEKVSLKSTYGVSCA